MSDSRCAICGQLAHGNHFGVLSCRACAAFFRRATLNPKKQMNLNCIHGKNAEIKKGGSFSCKKCRLRTCLEKGMDASKFQLDRDLLITSSTVAIPFKSPSIVPQTLANFLGRPNFLIMCHPIESEFSGPYRNMVDFTFILEQVFKILKNGSCSPLSPELCSLEKISVGFENLRILKSTELQYLTQIGKDQTMLFWEQEILGVAEWLTNFGEFTALPINVQMEFVKSIWKTYGRYEKLAKTAEYRRKKVFKSENLYMVGDEACLDTENTKIDVSWWTNYSPEQVAYFKDCFHNDIFQEIIKELGSLNPTTTELNFMLLQVCLQQAGKQLKGDVATTADYLQEVISDQLHLYYINVRNMPNYSARMIRMMKINNLMMKDLRRQAEKRILAETFDVYILQFSHPEMQC